MSAWSRRCDRTDWHVSHQWGIEYGDMGTIWHDCPGIDSWETDDRGVYHHSSVLYPDAENGAG